MNDAPRWEQDGAGWPNRTASRFVDAAGLRWHVQQVGTGPAVLLLHGTGAATHSWAGLLPCLAPNFSLLAPDLPGHGFTTMPEPGRMSLPGMAGALAKLLRALDFSPQIVVGHSAGAAIAARMCLDQLIAPRLLVSLNGALLPPEWLPMQLFAPLARIIGGSRLVPRLFAWQAADARIMDRLLANTGSAVPEQTAVFYRRLARRPAHAAAALAMMGQWDLSKLAPDLPALAASLVLIAGSNDRTIPPAQADRTKALVAGARMITLAGLGHLAHEEAPALVATHIRAAAA